MNGSISLNVPGSSNNSTRSRAVFLPLAFCLAFRSAPPPSSDFARTLRSSRILGSSVVMGLPHMNQYSETAPDKLVMDGIQEIGQSASSFHRKLFLINVAFLPATYALIKKDTATLYPCFIFLIQPLSLNQNDLSLWFADI